MRYGYTLFEIHKTDSGAVRFETLAQIPVDPNKRHIRHLIAGLRPWATERLAAAWHDLGLYQASFSSVREDGELGPAVAEHYLVWDGREEVAIAPPPHRAAGSASCEASHRR